MGKKLIWLFMVVLSVLAFVNRSLLKYGWMQAQGQLKVVWESKPIEYFMVDPLFPDSLKVKLEMVQDIRRYCFDSLGLHPSDNYTKVYDQEGQSILWNLSACKEFSFVPKRWSFPFLGSFPYKGFFDFDKAKDEKKVLDSLGYDARIRTVGGWSTLGWFSDPILSNMLNRGEGSLAELLIHELTHGTLYVKDNISFNENLATFIGEKGARLYLKSKYGANSVALLEYEQREADYSLLSSHFLKGYQFLNHLYQDSSFSQLTYDDKYASKMAAIDSVISAMDTLGLHNTSFQQYFQKTKPNNAYFMSYKRYYGEQGDFQSELDSLFGGDLRKYMSYLEKKYPSL